MEEYQRALTSFTKITSITKYRDFKYRLLVNAIFTNNRLFYWKKVPSQKCEYCPELKQTVQHLLYDCPSVRKIWEEFLKFVYATMNISRVTLDFNI